MSFNSDTKALKSLEKNSVHEPIGRQASLPSRSRTRKIALIRNQKARLTEQTLLLRNAFLNVQGCFIEHTLLIRGMNVMRWLVPKIDRATLLLALKSALAGCLIFGCYGAIQDQITFSISSEYFTVLKFDQFPWADPGIKNPRWFVALIGFIAAGGGGAVSSWILARIAIASGKSISVLGVMRGFWLCPLGALVFGPLGFLWGRIFPTPQSWLQWMDDMGITNQRGFSDVGMIHNFSYVGAISGLVIAAISLRKRLAKKRA